MQETGFYGFKWRNYDTFMGRFFNVDPLSEKYAFQSHYNFSENRLTNARELEGLEAVDFQWSGYDNNHGDLWNAFHFNWDVSFSWGGNDNNSSAGSSANNSVNVGEVEYLGVDNGQPESDIIRWEAEGKSYEQVTSNTLITRNLDGSNPTYNFILPRDFGGWSQDDIASDGLIWKGCLSCHADNGAFTYATHNSQEANSGRMASAVLQAIIMYKTFGNSGSVGDLNYEIGEGVRRTYIMSSLGSKTITATNESGEIFQVPIKNLFSPMKSSIPNDARFQNLLNSIKTEGQKFPIYVQPGNRGIPASQIKLGQ